MPVHIENKLGFVHIPRNGGTFIEHLMGIHNDRPLSGFGENHNHSGDLNYLFGSNIQHLGYADMLNLLGNKAEELKWFAVIRNPEERFISILCYMMKCPLALTSLKKMLGCLRNIMKLWISFYYKNSIIHLLSPRGGRQVNVYEPHVQHLLPQNRYLRIETIKKTRTIPPVEIYPFQEINNLHLYIPGLDSEILGDKIPNKSGEKPLPKAYIQKIISVLTHVFYRKDWHLYNEASRHWNETGEPLVLTFNR